MNEVKNEIPGVRIEIKTSRVKLDHRIERETFKTQMKIEASFAYRVIHFRAITMKKDACAREMMVYPPISTNKLDTLGEMGAPDTTRFPQTCREDGLKHNLSYQMFCSTIYPIR